jgi:hypothetical protein
VPFVLILSWEAIMDYAFVPGVSPYEDLLKRVMKSRNNTTLVNQAGVSTIADFLQSLVTNSHQADNLILGAHASDETFAMAFDSTTKVPKVPTPSNGRDYEMLEAVQTAGTIHIPAAVRTATTNCHLKGCNVGAEQTKPFLTLFKTDLGAPQQVTAPKYFHSLKDDAGRGVLESMEVEFTVTNPTAFPDTATLADAFRKKGFTQGVEKNGAQVPVPDKWKNWVSASLDLAPWVSDEKPIDISTRIVPPAGGLKLIDRKNGRCTSRFVSFPAYQDMTGKTVPPDKTGQMGFLKAALQNDAREKAGHLFPLHVRFGFSDIDEWIKGFDWTPTFDGTRLLTFNGSQYVYGVRLPIVKTGTNHLIYNYYPTTGRPKMNFLEDNAKFVMFGSV